MADRRSAKGLTEIEAKRGPGATGTALGRLGTGNTGIGLGRYGSGAELARGAGAQDEP